MKDTEKPFKHKVKPSAGKEMLRLLKNHGFETAVSQEHEGKHCQIISDDFDLQKCIRMDLLGNKDDVLYEIKVNGVSERNFLILGSFLELLPVEEWIYPNKKN